MFARGYVPGRSGQIFIVPERGSFLLARSDSAFYQFMHGSPWDYDTEIPLLFYGRPFIRKGTFPEVAGLQDVAPTLMTLLRFAVPTTMTGRTLSEAIEAVPDRPAATVLIVLDGMGAETWERLGPKLPTLSRLRREGAWFSNAALDYLPTVTSTGHATVSTGTDPRFHGIQANTTFDRRTGKQEEPFPGMNPANYSVLTLADHWNLATSDGSAIVVQGATPRATVALAGHGACTSNGRKIVVAMFDEKTAGWTTNETCFRLPNYLADNSARRLWETAPIAWMDHKVDNAKAFLRTGFYPSFQVDALVEMIEGESVGRDSIPDLLLVNFKTPDYVAHLYGPASREMEEALRVLDEQIGRLLHSLDDLVGAGRYVIVMTADHGMPPEPMGPNDARQYVEDMVVTIHERFDSKGKLILDFEDANHQMYVDGARLDDLQLKLEDVARFVETLPSIRFAFTEDEIRAARIR